jgi:ribosomal protein L23
VRSSKILGLVALLSLFCTPAMTHPYHVTMAEAEWNKKTGALEIGLKLRPEDLERALSAGHKKRITLDKTAKYDKILAAYLAKHFLVKDSSGKTQALKFVGKELNLKSLWLYFEVPLKSGLEGAKVIHKMLFEVLPDQVNTVNFKADKKRCSVHFTLKHPKATIRLKAKENSTKKKKD